jgi:transposase
LAKKKQATRAYRQHSAEFKLQAVTMVLEEKRRKSEVARDLEISESLLENWIASYRETGVVAEPRQGKKKGPDAAAKRIRELEKELERVKMERDILKKAAAYFAKDSE